MSYDISALKVLIKKIFPPKKCVFTVDTNGDGDADAVLIKALNVIMPVEIPETIEFGGFNSEDFDLKNFELSDYGKFYLDDEPIDVSSKEFEIDKLKEHFLIYHGGDCFKIDDIIKGGLSGRLIALGDSINILIRLEKEGLKKFTLGKHKFTLESELVPKFEFNFELTQDNINQKFDPSNL
ncbi:MAG: hypothetical protein ACFE85_14345 [Candidatus Hodarchaeota archaeon]